MFYMPNICFLDFLHLFYWLIYLFTIFHWLQILYFSHFSVFKFGMHLTNSCCLEGSWVLLDIVSMFWPIIGGTATLRLLKWISLRVSWATLLLWIQTQNLQAGQGGCASSATKVSPSSIPIVKEEVCRLLCHPFCGNSYFFTFPEAVAIWRTHFLCRSLSPFRFVSWASFICMVRKIMVY